MSKFFSMQQNQITPFEFNPSPDLESEIKRRGQIDARISKRTARERQQFRKNQTRRKIIAGAIVLKYAEKNPRGLFSKMLFWMLDQYVIGEKERRLFDLEVLSNPQSLEKNFKTGSLRKFFNKKIYT